MRDYKFLISVYTNACKQYCHREFFDNLKKLSKGSDVVVVDNSSENEYCKKIMQECILGGTIYKTVVEQEPERTLFLRNVEESVNLCRHQFLSGDYDGMLVIESDVIPPVDLLTRLRDTIQTLPEDWGILGGIYYQGFHDYSLEGVHPVEHVLSGCTVYNSPVLDQFKFRWDEDNLGAFPDAFMSKDAREAGYKLFNDHSIVCDHLSDANGCRHSTPQ